MKSISTKKEKIKFPCTEREKNNLLNDFNGQFYIKIITSKLYTSQDPLQICLCQVNSKQPAQCTKKKK